MRLLILTLCGALLLGTSQTRAYPIQGFGATPCAEFARLYRLDPALTENQYYYWAQGYMSGLNIMSKGSGGRMRELAGVTADHHRAIRNYCADNPLKNYMDGVLELFGKLPFVP